MPFLDANPTPLPTPVVKKKVLYTPLPTPKRPKEFVSMDHMPNFPSTKHGNDCMFWVVDQSSKMVISTPCNRSITIEATTKLFFKCVWVILAFHVPLFNTETISTWVPSGLTYG